MDSEVREVLLGVRNGSMSVDQALLHLKQKPFEDIGYAKVDLHRRLRQGSVSEPMGSWLRKVLP